MCSMVDLCFMCLKNDNNCSVVDNNIVIQVEYLMPEIRIIKMRLPLHICSICEKNLQFFNTFKQDCVENTLRLEARIKEAQDNTDIEKYSVSETNINKIHEVYIKEEVLDETDTTPVKYSLIEEIFIKEHPVQENVDDREFGDVLHDILKDESPLQTDTHLHEENSVVMDDDSAQNSGYPDDVVSVTNETNSDKNILVTGSADRKIYTCLLCKKDFKQLSYLKNFHMKIHIGKKEFQCNECNKCFIHKSNLTKHMKHHFGVKNFQCKECKKWFLNKSNFVRHMKQHTGVKDFQCNECRKWFSQKSHLALHMVQHTGLKEFQCNECKKWFSQKSNLSLHMKQHTGIKESHCNVCNKWFSQKSYLAIHMKQHTGIKDLKCTVCNKMFCHKSNLNRHMKTHGPINSEG